MADGWTLLRRDRLLRGGLRVGGPARQRRPALATATAAEARYTATGFPRVFYLRYHGYAKFFPLWALARYRNLKKANSKRPAYGM